ncbi:prephenate dehydrogenase [bacterium]|nr:prephenate dehydrogenase [bacterium]
MGFDRLTVIGVGLIGGSFALAARSRHLVKHVIGVARSEATRQVALECGVADEVTADAAAAAASADLIYLACPVGAMGSVMEAIAPVVQPGALVTDAGSTKAHVVDLAAQHLEGRCAFVAGHPMAGSDQAGPAAARDDLFEDKPYILTPTPTTHYQDLARLRDFIQALGAHVVLADAEQHDRLVAATSHLPHLVAAALCTALADLASRTGDVLPFTGTGLRDATRIAKGPSEVWRDILLDNRDNVKAALQLFSAEVNRYLVAMEAEDGAALESLLREAQTFRKGLDEA